MYEPGGGGHSCPNHHIVIDLIHTFGGIFQRSILVQTALGLWFCGGRSLTVCSIASELQSWTGRLHHLE